MTIYITMQPLVYLPDLPGGPAQSRPGPWGPFFHRELGEFIGVNGDLAVDVYRFMKLRNVKGPISMLKKLY